MTAIIAIATATGQGGIGIIRISSPKDLSPLFPYLLKRKTLQPRYAHYGAIYDFNDFNESNNVILDTGISIYFPAPHSYTGENVLELQIHGGTVLLQMMLKSCLSIAQHLNIDMRLAHAGEFSERAFLNDKMDLIQAESIMDLIQANSEAAVLSASRSLQGGFSAKVNPIVQNLIHLRLLVEATLDFPEEEIDFLQAEKAYEQLLQLIEDVRPIIDTAEQGVILHDGINIVLVGIPNAGKSSLLNCLAQKDVAIVTDIAGTTRDTISQKIIMNGITLNIIDTAGLRQTDDIVEKIGIQKTMEAINDANIIVHLIDTPKLMKDKSFGEQNLNHWLTDFNSMNASKTKKSQIPMIQVFNKIDEIDKIDEFLANNLNQHNNVDNQIQIQISAKTGQGIDALKNKIFELVGFKQQTEGVFMARERHIQALIQTLNHLQEATHYYGEEQIEMLAEELRLAQNAMQSITGKYTADDLLGAIFGTFCIGK